MSNFVHMDSKLPSNGWVHILAIMADSYLKTVFSQKSEHRCEPPLICNGNMLPSNNHEFSFTQTINYYLSKDRHTAYSMSIMCGVSVAQ